MTEGSKPEIERSTSGKSNGFPESEGATAALQAGADLTSPLHSASSLEVDKAFVNAAVSTLREASSAEEVLDVLDGKSKTERDSILLGYREATNEDFLSNLDSLGLSKSEEQLIKAVSTREDDLPPGLLSIELSLRTIEREDTTVEERLRAERMIRSAIMAKDSTELEDLDRGLRSSNTNSGIEELLLQSQDISDETKRALKLSLYGTDSDDYQSYDRDWRLARGL